MVAEWVALGVLVAMVLAELLHWRRCRRLARLAFGPQQRATAWARCSPLMRIFACVLAAWGLTALLLMDPKVHSAPILDRSEMKHLLLVVDVSPSMYLEDAGPEKNISRRERAADVLTSLFSRLPMREYQVSLIAFYTGAKPLLAESRDPEIVRHIVAELPIYSGFRSGKTDLFSGLQLAATTAKNWRPKSTTVVVITDGVTVPPTGMPRMPNSVNSMLVVGVGDAQTGKFIDGHQSRQDVSNLRQVANRIRGVYHDANTKHIPTSTIIGFSGENDKSQWWRWGRRELALAASFLGGIILALLPILLHYKGTSWAPGRKVSPTGVSAKTKVAA